MTTDDELAVMALMRQAYRRISALEREVGIDDGGRAGECGVRCYAEICSGYTCDNFHLTSIEERMELIEMKIEALTMSANALADGGA